MDAEQFIEQANRHCREGNECDDAGDAVGAKRHYTHALLCYDQLAHWEESDMTRAILLAQCENLMARLNELNANGATTVRNNTDKLYRRLHAIGVDVGSCDIDDSEESEESEGEGKDILVQRTRKTGTSTDQHSHETELDKTRLSSSQLRPTQWSDVQGLHNVKEDLLLYTKHRVAMPDLFRDDRAACILLYGPPGTGKTMIARALACESGMDFFAPSCADIVSKYVGDSASNISKLFDMVRKSKSAVLFLDEIENICPGRDTTQNLHEEMKRTVAEILIQLDGVGSGDMSHVVVIGATNMPWQLDEAVLSRFPNRFHVPLPDYAGRLAILNHCASRRTTGIGEPLSQASLEHLASVLHNYSGRDIDNLFHSAYNASLKQLTKARHFKPHGEFFVEAGEKEYDCGGGDYSLSLDEVSSIDGGAKRLRPRAITIEMLEEARSRVKAGVCDPSKLARYEEWTAQNGSLA